MAILKVPLFLLLVFSLILALSVIQGSRTSPEYQTASLQGEAVHLQGMKLQGQEDENKYRNSRRLMIGSTRPTCTYNECRGCKYRCRAEQVPVEGNDPINSAYHYRCVCHR